MCVTNMASEDVERGFSAFSYVHDHLYCEKIALHELMLIGSTQGQEILEHTTPLFVYSRQQLLDNIKSYQNAILTARLDNRTQVFYAVKANANLQLMDLVRQQALGAVTVSGFELLAALKVGFTPSAILLNGNGKQRWEIDLAVKNGCMLNVDSLFDAENIVSSVRQLQRQTRVLLRVNPALNESATPVHQYLATALRDSKFGIPINLLDKVTEILQQEKNVKIVGLHCHIGSTIRDASVYKTVVEVLVELKEKLSLKGINIQYFDIGGGLGIDYYRGTNSDQPPLSSVLNLIKTIGSVVPPEINVILEPGRSLVANTGVLLTRVLGTKGSEEESSKFIVVDAAMTDLIRPSFYNAYHHVLSVVRKPESKKGVFNIVGPVCESGDFLALKRHLEHTPAGGDLLAVMDVGAYGMAMSSNYNMRARAAEILVEGDSWRIIRRREDFDTLIQTMTCL